MPALTPDLMRKLAQELAPVLRFSDLEQFFPVRAESWLTHASSMPWAADPDDVGGLAADPHRRGTALCTSDPEVSPDSVEHIAGPPNPTDLPLQLTPGPGPQSIGDPAYQGSVDPMRELFLSFAGWDDPSNPWNGGDLDYLYEAFSELASAMNHSQPWTPLGTRPNRPHFAIEQPPSPAAYCEIDWAGTHPRSAAAHNLGDFPPPPITQLDGLLQITYHLLFPARTALASQPGVSNQEGQWAALSLFLPGRAGKADDPSGRPAQFELTWEAQAQTASDAKQGAGWVVLSVDANDFTTPISTVLRLPSDIEIFQAHVFAYVGAGTHRLFPHATPEVVMGPADQWPDLTYEPGSDVEGFLTFAVLGALVGAAVGAAGVAAVSGLLAAAAAGALVGAFAGAVIGIILWALFELLSELWKNDASPADIPPTRDAPVNPGSSSGDPSFGGSNAPTPGDPTQAASSGANDEVGGSPADGAFWPTNEGSADGWDTAYTDIKVISRFAAISESAPDLQPPPWWGYTGRWGINVPLVPNAIWLPGLRRTDYAGRSWAYWHAHALLDELVRMAPGPSGP